VFVVLARQSVESERFLWSPPPSWRVWGIAVTISSAKQRDRRLSMVYSHSCRGGAPLELVTLDITSLP